MKIQIVESEDSYPDKGNNGPSVLDNPAILLCARVILPSFLVLVAPENCQLEITCTQLQPKIWLRLGVIFC